MSDVLQDLRQDIENGVVSAQTLVSLYRFVEQAAGERDLLRLEAALDLARIAAAHADEILKGEAERLTALGEEHLAAVRGELAAANVVSGEMVCPGCGRSVSVDAVRCRSCGELLV